MSQPRMYGGWRKQRSIGIAGLGLGATLGLMGGLIVLVVAASINPAWLLYLAPPFLLAALFMAIPVQGESLAAWSAARFRWWLTRMKGHSKYQAGVMIEHPRAFQLPGILAPISLLDVEDGRGGRYGVAWHRRTGHMTATLRTAPNSTWLAESHDVDTWVANWHAWLARLGYMPWVSWVAVTVETAPDPGSTLRDQVLSTLNPQAPAEAHKIMNDLVAAAPAVSANVETRVSITFDPRKFPAAPKTRLEAVAELGNYLNELEASLGNCGVSVLGRSTPQHLVATVRNAYEPDARGETNRLLTTDPETIRTDDWADAGPMGAEIFHDHYRHDGGVSVAWVWQEAPRTNVTSSVLAKLLAPTRYTKRTTLLYRPWPAASAAATLESQRTAAQYRSELSRRVRHQVSARDRQDEERAAQAAREESMGAGLVQMSMYVTVTVTDEEKLPGAIAQTESAAESSRIRLRRAWGSQDVAFATTLPLGICPPWLLQRLNGW
ncbi:SCO6880 family protein [Marinactinospora thermotolerans]|uniref:Type VII secretion protein EccE n=1 Tax=Marinactinospora thermotolerans DSM 45154 TaxID=1122192 RepID=A0A1T4QPE5_9ACTN|nr:SCO6880 family protein [Marinactinospora thermotolerans]SKA05642.1 hypothetical protein SAMN02745673_02357 [Marinactinospora thermotolerans DSM 45154]